MALPYVQTLVNSAMNPVQTLCAAALWLVGAIFGLATDTAVVDTLLKLVLRSLEALTQSLSGAAMILRGIFTNETNSSSLDFILDHLSDLFQFLYDLFKPSNVIPRFPAAMSSNNNGTSSTSNPYNELDLRLDLNRKAVVYQIQRTVMTLASILRVGKDVTASSRGIADLTINASLRSDFDAQGRPPPATYTASLTPGNDIPRPDEKWLFINGIANEFHWFTRSCDKIRDTFRRDVKGIYNRSDGILWDIVECCGERSATSQSPNTLIQRTRSSAAAQDELVKELSHALRGAAGTQNGKVVMIAHSQGVLILRLALQRLVADHPKGTEMRRAMRERLWVFTFGSPSVDWRAIDGDMARPLGEFARVTEHFAHRADFVAMLGVATHQEDAASGYDDDAVFYSRGGRGHLFGAHYSLGVEAWEDGERSRLLGAVAGRDLV
ncbi:hypothetical protein B0T11DRAFT_254952 [Plectosphaerella cucumerina]|uniref:DUF676 domain-containing protein n=1 Tax=Plectosphaerella cucumerina TaxID=40658 RepID=A0A8K0X2F5_9PEZI|nr:hypothetical protein B0T11DRAFT_254952 [Plectosphaerella cucumerina]